MKYLLETVGKEIFINESAMQKVHGLRWRVKRTFQCWLWRTSCCLFVHIHIFFGSRRVNNGTALVFRHCQLLKGCQMHPRWITCIQNVRVVVMDGLRTKYYSFIGINECLLSLMNGCFAVCVLCTHERINHDDLSNTVGWKEHFKQIQSSETENMFLLRRVIHICN